MTARGASANRSRARLYDNLPAVLSAYLVWLRVSRGSMRQSCILDFLGSSSTTTNARAAAPSGSPLFVDLFCGVGGASRGAVDAGYRVVLAVDSDDEVLAVHRRNHPACEHVCEALCSESRLSLPRGANWHLHGSPPCTSVSKANQNRDEADRRDALETVNWFLNFAMQSGAGSWSMEQVGTPVLIKELNKIKADASTRKKFDFEVVNFKNYGVPQNRKRVIAGSPRLVAGLRRLRRWHRSTKDVIARPRGTHIRNYMVNSAPRKDPTGAKKWIYRRFTTDEACNRVTTHAPCVCSRGLQWITPGSGKAPLPCTVAELAALQCMQHVVLSGASKSTAKRGVMNAIPPSIMAQLLTGRPRAGML